MVINHVYLISHQRILLIFERFVFWVLLSQKPTKVRLQNMIFFQERRRHKSDDEGRYKEASLVPQHQRCFALRLLNPKFMRLAIGLAVRCGTLFKMQFKVIWLFLKEQQWRNWRSLNKLMEKVITIFNF